MFNLIILLCRVTDIVAGIILWLGARRANVIF